MYTSQKVAFCLLLCFLVSGVALTVLGYQELPTRLAMSSSILFGIAVIIYRLLRGTATRIVKYTHMIIHMVAIGLLIGALFLQRDAAETEAKFSAYLVIGMIIFQFIVAIFIFTYLYDYRRLRLYFAPFHDIFGIWIFICVVFTTLSGGFGAVELDMYMNLSYFCFIIIIVIVLSPYFEWELVGFI